MIDFNGWAKSEVTTIKAPTSIVFGDNNAVRTEYAVLQDAWIVNGTSN